MVLGKINRVTAEQRGMVEITEPSLGHQVMKSMYGHVTVRSWVRREMNRISQTDPSRCLGYVDEDGFVTLFGSPVALRPE